MHILFVAPFYKPAYVYGGPVYSTPSLCESLVIAGHDVSVITTNANGKNNFHEARVGFQQVDGVSVAYCQRDLPGYYFFSRQLSQTCYSEIRKNKFDIVYVASNWAFPFLPACRAAYRSGVPYIVSPRASFKRITWRGKSLKKWLYHTLFERYWINQADLIHYTTQMELGDSVWLKLKPPSVTIPNPINLAEFDRLPKKGLFRSKYKIASDVSLLLYLGRVEHAKGVDLALQALSLILPKHPNCILVVAGPEEENYVSVLSQQARDLGIQDSVVFTGLLSSAQRLEALSDADIFVFPSHSENFGMAVAEAMLCELPVVISDQVGISEFIVANSAGVVVPLQADAFSEAIKALLENPALKMQYAHRAPIVIRSNFSPLYIAEKFSDVFQSIILSRK
jgi:glycosyltransferase involved in cell wall biosynthesis